MYGLGYMIRNKESKTKKRKTENRKQKNLNKRKTDNGKILKSEKYSKENEEAYLNESPVTNKFSIICTYITGSHILTHMYTHTRTQQLFELFRI